MITDISIIKGQGRWGGRTRDIAEGRGRVETPVEHLQFGVPPGCGTVVSSVPVSLERSRSTALVSLEMSLEVVVREVVGCLWRTAHWGAACGFSLLILSFSSLRSLHMELL